VVIEALEEVQRADMPVVVVDVRLAVRLVGVDEDDVLAELNGVVVGRVPTADAVDRMIDMEDSATRPAMGTPSFGVKGEPKAHIGWSWPNDRTKELQQYWQMPSMLFRRITEQPLCG
jgi:hypothetical protein